MKGGVKGPLKHQSKTGSLTHDGRGRSKVKRSKCGGGIVKEEVWRRKRGRKGGEERGKRREIDGVERGRGEG